VIVSAERKRNRMNDNIKKRNIRYNSVLFNGHSSKSRRLVTTTRDFRARIVRPPSDVRRYDDI